MRFYCQSTPNRTLECIVGLGKESLYWPQCSLFITNCSYCIFGKQYAIAFNYLSVVIVWGQVSFLTRYSSGGHEKHSTQDILQQIFLETWYLGWEGPSAKEHFWHNLSMTSSFLFFLPPSNHRLLLENIVSQPSFKSRFVRLVLHQLHYSHTLVGLLERQKHLHCFSPTLAFLSPLTCQSNWMKSLEGGFMIFYLTSVMENGMT